MAKILAVDDDPQILRLLQNILELNDHEVVTYENATQIKLSTLDSYDLILLDIMMPELDGLTFCGQIRDLVSCPILFLTAKVEEDTAVKSLLQGGDDFIRKPFGVQELNARISAHLRREQRRVASKKLVFDRIVVELDQCQIKVAGEALALTPHQYKICEYLALHAGLVFSKEQIYEAVYGLESDTLFSTITEHIRVIRQKFKAVDCQPIETVWGVGYRWQ